VRLSVVIPTWREAPLVAEAVRAAARVGDEVVVADAGSPDGTADVAVAAGARVVRSPKGRGAQLHAGALAASGDVLLFLHADARLPPAARAAIDRSLADPRVVGGNFLLRFEPDGAVSRIFAWANDARRRRLRIYYGDSALFVRSSAYSALGGFLPLPILEDYELIRRLERLGPTAYVRDVRVVASARRFAAAPVSTLLGWTVVQGLYSLGVPAEHLARLYRDVRGRALDEYPATEAKAR
jgi:rSAM/selenodomain-associated transferase 2